MLPRPAVRAALAASFAASLVAALALTGAQPPRGVPGPRTQPALLYDAGARRLLLVDGTYPAVQRAHGELWGWDGRAWTLVADSGPTPRYAGAAAYDARRARVVTYGGRVGRAEEIRAETWEWDGRAWALAADTSAGRRDHHALAYDAARGVTVMFGGGPYPRPAGEWATDTWTWDGVRWTRAATDGPVGRVTAMVYDARRREVVLFGGVGRGPAPGAPQPSFGDTWTWDGRAWRLASETGPSPRNRHALAFDERAGVVLLYGGSRDGRDALGDMWRWDGARWTEIPLDGPTPGRRALHAMAYDPARGRTVLYGGNHDGRVVDDTWEWDGTRWHRVR